MWNLLVIIIHVLYRMLKNPISSSRKFCLWTCQIIYMILTANQMNEISSLLHKFTSWTCLNCTSFNNVNFVMSLMIKLMHHVHSLKKKISQSDKRVLHLLAKIFFYCQMTGSLWVTSLCRHDVGQPSFLYLFFTSIIFKF